MYTWFDALLVTLLALVTALGVRRGLAGLLWGVAALLACLIANMVMPHPLLAVLAALALSAAAAFAAGRLAPDPAEHPWYGAAGGIGGLLLGALLISALTLSFPLEVRGAGAQRQTVYPASTLPGPVQAAVGGSVIKRQLMQVWTSGRVLQTLIIPDQVR